MSEQQKDLHEDYVYLRFLRVTFLLMLLLAYICASKTGQHFTAGLFQEHYRLYNLAPFLFSLMFIINILFVVVYFFIFRKISIEVAAYVAIIACMAGMVNDNLSGLAFSTFSGSMF